MMNEYFIAAAAVSALACLVHVVRGNRLYGASRPEGEADGSNRYVAWLTGRCGFQLIAVDLLLTSLFLGLLGCGGIADNRPLELFLLAQYAGWTVAWLAGLTVERAHGKRYLRLCQ